MTVYIYKHRHKLFLENTPYHDCCIRNIDIRIPIHKLTLANKRALCMGINVCYKLPSKMKERSDLKQYFVERYKRY